ncbi:HEAT repeat domain-containing protein [Mucisphaera calidilacus]|uniref:HEAT repeat domain-containing protein n=1 Tax=Mucisphaera calidilacus TaxID=2527982 RepID=A0A518C0Q3_9BACT|nr:hypothetical protein [Mucisphaera calidilacus]QDU72801.1 hypothetical protein Pan265_26750 [Mucisphaera calidilacus]
MNGPKALIRYFQSAALGLLILPAATLLAQDRLPSEIYTADPLTDGQTQAVQIYINELAQALAEDDADLRQRSRRSLTNPLRRPSASQNFLQIYTGLTVEALKPNLDNEDFAVRLNTLIILAELKSHQGLELAATRINDPNAAVRYWAIRCFEVPEARTQLNQEEITAHLDLLAGQLAIETSEAAAIRLTEAIDSYDTTLAHQKLIDALYLRLSNNVKPNSLATEQRALTQTFRWLIRARSDGVEITPLLADVAALGHANARRAQTMLQQNPQAPLAADTIRVVDQILDLTREMLFPNTQTPTNLQRHLIREDWNALANDLNTWSQLLLDPAIDLDPRARAIVNP